MQPARTGVPQEAGQELGRNIPSPLFSPSRFLLVPVTRPAQCEEGQGQGGARVVPAAGAASWTEKGRKKTWVWAGASGERLTWSFILTLI